MSEETRETLIELLEILAWNPQDDANAMQSYLRDAHEYIADKLAAPAWVAAEVTR